MKRIMNMLKSNAAVLLAAGALYVFAMACSKSPTAPTSDNNKTPTGQTHTIAKPDTFPPR